MQSVLSQSYEDLEVIVVDDGSIDDTAATARSIGDPRVKVLPNARAKGAQGARNTGILAARAEWIAFNDSDDEWLPEKLRLQMDELRRRGYAPQLVVHGDAVQRSAGRPERTRLKLPRTEGDAYRRLLLRPAPMFQALVASRSLIQAIGLLDETLCAYQEWDTAIRLAEKGKFIHLREPLFVYLAGHEGAISSNPRRGIDGYAQVLRKHAGGILAAHGYAGLRRHFQWLIRRAASFGASDSAQALMAEAISRCRLVGVRRSLLESTCHHKGLLGAMSHRLAQCYDRAALLANRTRAAKLG